MKAPPLRALLVEDEPLCQVDFRQTIIHCPEVEMVGETDTLEGARRFLRKHTVDLLFLDLSVGRENGLDLVASLPTTPWVIALTAHPQHAVRGFSLNLVDYILKPVELDRLKTALAKVHHRMAAAPLIPGQVTFLAEAGGKKRVVQLAEIIMTESMGNYMVLHTLQGRAIQRATFKQTREKLPPRLFLEIARGCMVARSQVRGWSRDNRGHLVLELSGGKTVRTAKSRNGSVLKALQAE